MKKIIIVVVAIVILIVSFFIKSIYDNNVFIEEKEKNVYIDSNYKIDSSDSKYESSNEEVVIVTEDGILVPKDTGSSTITIKDSKTKKTKKIKVNIVDTPLDSIVLKKEVLDIKVNDTYDLKNVLPDSDIYYSYNYSVTNPKIAEIDNNGLIKALHQGETDIIISSGNLKTTLKLIVLNNEIEATSIVLSNKSFTIKEGSSTKISAYVYPENAKNKNVYWKSNNDNIATVDNNGNIKAIKVGTTTIVVTTDNGLRTNSIVKVVENKDSYNKEILVSSISVEQSNIVISENVQVKVNYTILPETATNKQVEWLVEDDSILEIDNDGTVTGKKEGTTNVVVKASNNKSTSFIVTVKKEKINVESIKLNINNKTVYIGDIFSLTETITPSNATNKNVVWKSSDEDVICVNNGRVYAVGVGTANIIVTSNNGLTDSCTIVVNKKIIDAKSVSLNTNNIKLEVGGSTVLSAIIAPDDTSNKTLSWTSSDTNVATVKNGKVTAIGEGTAIITVKTINNKTATCNVTVNKKVVMPKSVTLNKSELRLIVGDTYTLTAAITPSDATDKTLSWSSSNTKVATVKNGKVTAIGKGTAIITVKTYNNKVATCTITVKEIDVKSITLNKNSISTTRGNNVTLKATISPSDATNKTVSWTSSNTKIATVKNGIVTPVGGGTTTITAKTVNGKTATTTITVVSERIHFLSHLNKEVHINDPITGDATLLESNGHFAMIDVGVNRSTIRKNILKYLKDNNATTLDFVLFTHMHGDHVGSLEFLLENGIKIKNIYMKNYNGVSANNNGQDYYNQVIGIANKYNIPITYLNNKEGQTKTFKYLKFSITYYNAVLDKYSKNDNCNSLAVLFETKSIDGTYHRAFLPGDNYSISNCNSKSDMTTYTSIINSIKSKNIEVYKLPHHGSKSGMLDIDSVSALKPKYIVVTSSAAKVNRIKELYPNNNLGIDRVPSTYSKSKNNLYYVDETNNALVVDFSNKIITINRK